VQKTTEQASHYQNLETMSLTSLLIGINEQDQQVPKAIELVLPKIAQLVEAAYERMAAGGRLFYLGAGTSGRLGIVDASECPPTYGVPQGLVVGLIAGGDGAIRKAVEFAEDDPKAGWEDLKQHQVCDKDFVVGIAASGTTPYVVGALAACNEAGIATGCITCNAGSPVAIQSKFPIEVIVGPEFVTGSTRMKAGTAQKLVLNMISTSLMIKLGKVAGNKMVDMKLSNHKLIERGTNMVAEATGLDSNVAKDLLLKYGSVRAALKAHFQSR
jgi:N-acetylmuramic acid 6-phosphate etherase